MDNFISDHRKRVLLQRLLNDRSQESSKLKNLALCGKATVKLPGYEEAVFIMTNDKKKQANLTGVVSCHSPWACPVCSAKVMAKRGAEIACLIDALATWQDTVAIMITYTIPHIRGMDCKTIFKCLKLIWTKFRKRHAGKTYKNTKYQFTDSYAYFQHTVESKYNVKIYEFTWGKNSWHPHIHQLFFLPRKNLDKIENFIPKLRKSWWKDVQSVLKSQLGEEKANEIFKITEKKAEDHGYGFWISLDENNKPKIQKSSYYVTGWTGDAELTKQNFKIPNEGHFTPQMILDEAFNDPYENNKYINLYIEYALATKGSRRVEFSKLKNHSCKEIITKWRLSNEYREIIIKKNTVKDQGKWKVEYWLSKKQWKKISEIEDFEDINITVRLLKCIDLPKTKRRGYIESILIRYNIPLTKRRHRHIEAIENAFNMRAIKEQSVIDAA